MTARLLKEKILYFISRKVDYPLLPARNVTLTLNYICNQNCIMCGIKNLRFDKKYEINVEEIKKIINEMVEIDIPDLVLTGGEPFLYEGIFDVIEYAKRKNRKVIMITNGFYDECIADRIINSGVDHLQVSLDGSTEKVYDSIRGAKGSFNVVIKNIRKFIAGGKSVGATVTVTSQNFRDLLNIAYLAKGLGCSSLAVRPAHVDNADPLDKDFRGIPFWIADDEMTDFKKAVEEWKSFNRINGYLDFPLAFDLLVEYFKTGYLPPIGSCFVGFTRLIISYNGKDSYGVWMCEDMIGNIRRNSLKDIWYGQGAMKLRKKIKFCTRTCLFPEMHEPGLKNLFSLSRDIMGDLINSRNRYKKG